MDNAVSVQQDHPLLRRRSSIPDVPPKLSLIPNHINSPSTTTTTSSDDDLELLTIRPTSFSYTSLRDILPPSAVNSPRPSQVLQSDSDICIRNRLVKQAAWAYLQPMSSSPGSAGEGFFHRVQPRVAAFFDFVCRGVIRVINWMLRLFSGSR